jgi:flagellar biogenesis protein FliO
MFTSLKKYSSVPCDPWAGIAGLAAFLRRIIPALGRRAPAGGALEHLGSLPLTAHSSLALVRLNQETLLLGITPQGITLLTKDVREAPALRKITTKKNSARAERRVAAEPIGR